MPGHTLVPGFMHDPAIDALVQDRDSDDLMDKCDLGVIWSDVDYNDMKRAVMLGRLAGSHKFIWESETSDGQCFVYFVGSLEEVIRRLNRIKRAE